MLEKLRPVDLTQPLGPDTVMWPGAPAPSFQTVLTVAHDGFYNRLVSFVEHTSTHFDAPCHMVEGTESVDVIGAERLVRPLAVIDIAAEVGDDADAALSLEQVQAFEARLIKTEIGSLWLARMSPACLMPLPSPTRITSGACGLMSVRRQAHTTRPFAVGRYD